MYFGLMSTHKSHVGHKSTFFYDLSQNSFDKLSLLCFKVHVQLSTFFSAVFYRLHVAWRSCLSPGSWDVWQGGFCQMLLRCMDRNFDLVEYLHMCCSRIISTAQEE